MSLSVVASQAYCTEVARQKGRNFSHAFRVLPRDQRVDMAVLYAYMRRTDDLADEGGSPDERRANLEAWEAEIDTAFDRNELEGDPALPAIVEMVRRRKIPRELLRTVIAGCGRDIGGITLQTYEEFREYGYQVAGVVGLCCLHIWGYDGSDAAEAKAVDTGLAMQLTNILRDLPEDTRVDRNYLPGDDLDRFGVTREQLREGYQTSEYLKLMSFETQRARGLYSRAEELMAHIEKPGRKALAAMLTIYRGLLDEIERREFDVYSTRVTVSPWRKVRAVVGALFHG